MLMGIIALLCAAVFAGASIYVTLVEHPARIQSGAASAIAEFGASYRRAARLQAPLATIGGLAALAAWMQLGAGSFLVAGILLGAMIPFTLIVIRPTNSRLVDPRLDRSSPEVPQLLRRWGRLHLVRTIAGGIALVLLVVQFSFR
jgi:hypothetical protein